MARGDACRVTRPGDREAGRQARPRFFPLRPVFQHVTHQQLEPRELPGARDAALSGGDDYELLFTAPSERRAELSALARRLDLPLSRIGAIRAGSDLSILDASGRVVEPPSKGWQHF